MHDPIEPPIIDRSAARATLLARHRDPSGPPSPGMVALRCTECGVGDQAVPVLRMTR